MHLVQRYYGASIALMFGYLFPVFAYIRIVLKLATNTSVSLNNAIGVTSRIGRIPIPVIKILHIKTESVMTLTLAWTFHWPNSWNAISTRQWPFDFRRLPALP